MARRSLGLAVGWLAVVGVYAGLARVWTDTDSPWYRSLSEPPWQPPDIVFGIIWPLNYLALAAVGIVMARNQPESATRLLSVFIASVVFALGWSYRFSEAHALVSSAFSLAIAAALTWVLLVIAWRAGKGYALGLIVYTLWMTLAASLSIGFAVLNA